jgi:hypothetical protein
MIKEEAGVALSGQLAAAWYSFSERFPFSSSSKPLTVAIRDAFLNQL